MGILWFFLLLLTVVAGRAVPSGIWLGGNLVPRVGILLGLGGWIKKFVHSRAPSKKIFRKANIFPQNVGGVDVLFPKTTQTFFQTLVLHYGGLNLVFNTFFDLNFPENSSIFNTSRNSSIPGPPLGKLGPLIYFSLGVLHPSPQHPPHPSSSGPACRPNTAGGEKQRRKMLPMQVMQRTVCIAKCLPLQSNQTENIERNKIAWQYSVAVFRSDIYGRLSLLIRPY